MRLDGRVRAGRVQRRQRRSRRQEEAGAAQFGGRRVPGSGSGWVTKNDVKTDDLSIEYKYTDKKSFSLVAADLEKAERQALIDGGREFAFIVELNGREYTVISNDYFERLRNGHPG
jgi:hypothetical protein